MLCMFQTLYCAEIVICRNLEFRSLECYFEGFQLFPNLLIFILEIDKSRPIELPCYMAEIGRDAARGGRLE